MILPDNYKPAVARLTSVWKSHLKDNPQGREAYSNTFDVQLTREIIEEVGKLLRIGECDRLVHYLAHHPVFRADKPTQLRIVFDGSARSGPGTRSLNDCLHPGPSLLESLIGILLRSRGAQILIIGDIEKAFLQISLREEDRDVTRFLWLRDSAKPPTPDNILVYRYKRIPFGLNASPFLLLATIEHHLKQVDSAVSREIRQNTYSDNVFLLAHTPEDGVQKYKETKLIFSDMKMNIREFSQTVHSSTKRYQKRIARSRPRRQPSVTGCRMVTFLRKEMLPELQRLHHLGDIPIYLWGDNQGVLYWIKDSSRVYTKFVQNRLSEIRLTANVSFRYVPTKDNPADVLPRGATTYELKSHTLWWHGAPWLAEDETQWPEQPTDFQPYSDEVAGNDGKVVEVHVVTRKEDRQALTPLLELLAAAIPKAVRTYSRMRRVLTVVLRFAGQLTAKRWKRNLRLPFLSPFSPTHTINVSEAYLCLLQYKASELMLVWEAQQAHPPTPAQASRFNVETFEDGLLRCRGRLEKGKMPYDTVNPIWLPERTRVASHVITSVHASHTHAPAETTLALIRRRFWLVKGRRNIRNAISRYCTGCRLVKGPAFRIQDYAQLPLERISKSRPFAHIGLDLFGPFLIRMGTAKADDPSQPATKRRGRKAPRRTSDEEHSDLKKVWGVIFTCMATRAVHLEVAHSLSAEHLMHALDRFMCCRGHPNSVTSENAPSIILVNRALAEMWKDACDDPCKQDYARDNAIEWRFITPESPWQGGFYERLIRSVKHCIKATVGRRRLEISNFEQLLGRVAHTLNCRPLTYQTEGDVNAVALRPIDLLQPLAEGTTNLGPLSAYGPKRRHRCSYASVGTSPVHLDGKRFLCRLRPSTACSLVSQLISDAVRFTFIVGRSCSRFLLAVHYHPLHVRDRRHHHHLPLTAHAHTAHLRRPLTLSHFGDICSPTTRSAGRTDTRRSSPSLSCRSNRRRRTLSFRTFRTPIELHGR